MSSDCKVPNVYGGTHPYGPGGIGVGGIFRSLFRTTTPFLKKTAKIVGTRMINTGLEKEMQILQDDMKSEPLKKGAKSRTKAAGKSLLEGTINNITQQGRGEEYTNVWLKHNQSVPIKTRNGDHPAQRSRPFLTNHGFSTPTLCSRRKLKPITVSSTGNRCVHYRQ